MHLNLQKTNDLYAAYTQYPLQEIQLQEPVLEFGKKLETTEILRLRDIQITGKLDPSKNDYIFCLIAFIFSKALTWHLVVVFKFANGFFCGSFLTS